MFIPLSVLFLSPLILSECDLGGTWSTWMMDWKQSGYDYCGSCWQSSWSRKCLTAPECPCNGTATHKVTMHSPPCAAPREKCCPGAVLNGNICGERTEFPVDVPPRNANYCPPSGTGIWGAWSEWGKCSAPCGLYGTKNRTRTCRSAVYGCCCTSDVGECQTMPCPEKPCPGQNCSGQLVFSYDGKEKYCTPFEGEISTSVWGVWRPVPGAVCNDTCDKISVIQMYRWCFPSGSYCPGPHTSFEPCPPDMCTYPRQSFTFDKCPANRIPDMSFIAVSTIKGSKPGSGSRNNTIAACNIIKGRGAIIGWSNLASNGSYSAYRGYMRGSGYDIKFKCDYNPTKTWGALEFFCIDVPYYEDETNQQNVEDAASRFILDNYIPKISLSRVSPGPGAVDLESTNILVDEVACSWREIRTRKVIPNYERPEPRIFTVAVDNKDPEEGKKSIMDIFAYLGDIADTSENELHNALICRITAYGAKTLVFEPPLTANGFQLEGKLGDYVARIHIYEDTFTSLTDDFAKMEIMNLPDAGVFDLSDESSVTLCYNITIETGKDFPFEAIALQWRIISQFLKSSKSSGCTGFAYPNRDDKNLWNFSYSICLVLNISMADISIGITNPQILLETDSEDGWGRQWIAGYACFSLPLAAGRTRQRIPFWRPFNPHPVSRMKEFFLGSPVELKSEDFLKDGGRRMFGMHTEASGSVDVTVTTLIHSRHFMAKDTLQHVKYGTRLGQIGLKTDLYWRIMKVLLEFEEARQMLLRSRKNA